MCAIAPAGGVVAAKQGASYTPKGLLYRLDATFPNFYQPCKNGRFLYKLGAINRPGDSTTDSCRACMRGSFATSGERMWRGWEAGLASILQSQCGAAWARRAAKLRVVGSAGPLLHAVSTSSL